MRTPCIHIGYLLIAILRQNAYMHEQITKEIVERKYLNECTPFGYIHLWRLGGRVLAWHGSFVYILRLSYSPSYVINDFNFPGTLSRPLRSTSSISTMHWVTSACTDAMRSHAAFIVPENTKVNEFNQKVNSKGKTSGFWDKSIIKLVPFHQITHRT